MRCLQLHIFYLLVTSAFLAGCREEYNVILTPPQDDDTHTLFIDSEIGSIILDVNFPSDRLNTIGKSRFLLTLDFEDGKLQSITTKPEPISAFIPTGAAKYERRRITIDLEENPNYPYKSQLNDANFSEEKLSNLPLGHIVIDGADWTIIPLSSRCTGFLVSPNLVVTNNHCVADQAECARTKIEVWNYKEGWLKRNFDTSSYQCKEVLYTDTERDQTLFRIDGNASFYNQFPVARRPMNLKKDEIFRLSTMDQSDFTGRVYRAHRKCVLLSEDGMQRSNDGKKYLEAQCDKNIYPGNSGSPVFDSEGYVFGVLWGKPLIRDGIAIFAPLNPTIIRLILEENT